MHSKNKPSIVKKRIRHILLSFLATSSIICSIETLASSCVGEVYIDGYEDGFGRPDWELSSTKHPDGIHPTPFEACDAFLEANNVQPPGQYPYDGGTFCTLSPTSYAVIKAVATCGPTVSDVDEAKNFGGPQSCGVGPDPLKNGSNPINSYSGNKYQTETDYTSPNSRLGFKRHYNSRVGNIWTSFLDGQKQLGSKNWSHTYSRQLKLFERVIRPESVNPSGHMESRIFVSRPDGKIYSFLGSAIIEELSFNTVELPAGREWRIKKQDGSSFQSERIVSTDTGFLYFAANGEVETYDFNGRLLSISALGGYTQTLEYSNGGLSSVTDSFGDTLTFSYDEFFRIETLTTPDGTITYTYDANNNLAGVAYPGDGAKTYIYDDPSWPNNITGIIDENGDRYATWAYDDQGRGILSQHGDGADQVNIFYNPDSTTTVSDVFGQSRVFHFQTIEGVAKVVQVDGAACTSCGGGAQSILYDNYGNPNLVTDFNGNVTDFDYEPVRNLETVRVEAFGTEEARMTWTTWHPDYPRKTCVEEPSRTTILEYHPNRMLHTRTEVDTSNTTLFPDAGSKSCDAIKARPDFASLNKRTWTYTYNANNQIATIDGPRADVNDTTTYVHNAVNGNLESVTNAAGHATNITAHDASGRPLRIVDANGLVTQLTYTPRGWTDLIKVGTDTLFETTNLDYDGVGQLIKVTLPDGSYLTYDYDPAHRLTDIRDQLGNHIHYTLDAMGNRTTVEVKDPSAVLKRTHSYVFNTLNQLSQSIGADKGADTQIVHYDEYDANGNLKKTRDAQGNITQYGYDALDRLDNVIDALNGTTSYSYDAMGNLATVTDPRNNTTAYQYDGLGNLTQLDSPDTGITSYTQYDGAGNLISQTDAKGQITAYQYDALNRLTQITYDDTSTTVYAYDVGANANGRLSSITDSSGSTSYSYDLHGRISNKTQTIGTTPNDISLPVAYHYNTQGQLDQITYPSGKVIGYTYSNGQISQLTVDGAVVLNNLSFDPFGPVTGWDMGPTIEGAQSPNSISRSYDLDGQLASYTLGNATKQISYANTGNITALQEVGNPANDQSFDYDNLYRLTDYTGLGDSHVYAYDANGNRTAQVINGKGFGYSVDDTSNQLQSTAGPTAKTYGYDAVGNIISDGLYTYNYDARNRLVALDTGVGYTLNGLGQRVAKSIPVIDPNSLAGDANGDNTVDAQDYSLVLDHILGTQTATNADCNEDGKVNDGDLICINIKASNNPQLLNSDTRFVYDEQGQLIGEYDQAGNVIQETVYLGNLPVAVLKDGNVYYIHADHLNTPRAITDAANNTYWSWLSDPFGVTAANEDPDGDGSKFTYNLRFPGQYFDEESGLHYNYFRDYDPGTGRYVQSDPIGLDGGLNTFSYAINSPLMYADPTGEYVQALIPGVIITIGVGIAIQNESGDRPPWWDDDIPHPSDPPQETQEGTESCPTQYHENWDRNNTPPGPSRNICALMAAALYASCSGGDSGAWSCFAGAIALYGACMGGSGGGSFGGGIAN